MWRANFIIEQRRVRATQKQPLLDCVVTGVNGISAGEKR